jgi:hypothetical protein
MGWIPNQIVDSDRKGAKAQGREFNSKSAYRGSVEFIASFAP